MSITSASSPEKQHVRLSPSQERTCVTASCNRIFLCSAKRCQSEKYVLLFLVQTYSNIHMFKTLFAVVCRVTPKVIHMSPKLWAHRVVRTACSHHIRIFFGANSVRGQCSHHDGHLTFHEHIELYQFKWRESLSSKCMSKGYEAPCTHLCDEHDRKCR